MPHNTQATNEARKAGAMMPSMSAAPQSTSDRDKSINLMPINGAIRPPTPYTIRLR
jgi:hypothetical protein